MRSAPPPLDMLKKLSEGFEGKVSGVGRRFVRLLAACASVALNSGWCVSRDFFLPFIVVGVTRC